MILKVVVLYCKYDQKKMNILFYSFATSSLSLSHLHYINKRESTEQVLQ